MQQINQTMNCGNETKQKFNKQQKKVKRTENSGFKYQNECERKKCYCSECVYAMQLNRKEVKKSDFFFLMVNNNKKYYFQPLAA